MSGNLERVLIREEAKLERQKQAVRATEELIKMIKAQLAQANK